MTIRRYHFILSVILVLIVGSVLMVSKGDLVHSERFFRYKVALTFDDGPHPGYTDTLVDILSRYNAKATFFVVGKQAERHPELLKLISSHGHEIGNHTYSHTKLRKLSKLKISSEVEKTSKIIKEIIKKDVKLFRPPGGDINKEIQNFITSLGYKVILWDIFSNDLSQLSKEEIYNNVIKNVKDGSIILFHSGSLKTLNLLPQLIKELMKMGYELVTVSEIIAYRNNKEKPLTSVR